ncbi:MAG: metal-sensing transcriptional repressor [Oligoflexia bacterium]|nr:metal-sensing transcriptional repressor [Oligoflexia bacterium]
MEKHQLHPDIMKRLKRASGHLSKVIEMLEKEEPCLKIAQQLQAVSKAIISAKTALVTQHIEDCLGESIPASKKNQFKEIKEITKYL